MMISLARAGPTSRTKRVAEATPSGTPRSTSGIQSWASAAAMRKSQASVRPQPPPTAWPLMAAMVVCSRFSSTVLARSKSRRNWLLRPANARRRSSADMLLLSPASAPAEKTGGAPVTMTTRVVGSSRSSAKTAPRSVSIGSLSELRRSGRLRVTVAMAPSRVSRTLSGMAERVSPSGWTGPPGPTHRRRTATSAARFMIGASHDHRDDRHYLAPHDRIRRALAHRPPHEGAGHRNAGRAAEAVRRGAGVVLECGGARPGRPLAHALHARARRLARRGLAPVVSGRPPELHRQLRRSPPGRRARRQAGRHLGRRRWAVAHAALRSAGGRGEPPRQRPEGARRRRGRPRRHLPADVAGGRDRHARRREARRHLHAVLLRFRRRGRRFAAVRLRGEAVDHSRRLPPSRPGHEDERDGGRGGRAVPVADDRARPSAAGPRDPVDGGTRSLVAP